MRSFIVSGVEQELRSLLVGSEAHGDQFGGITVGWY
jgi:hypothetical protein